MSFTLSENTLSVAEGSTFSQTISITEVSDDENGYSSGISSIEVIKPANSTGVTVTVNLSNSSITFAGAYNDVFVRQITYLDSNKIAKTTTSFAKLPTDFYIVTKMTPSSSTQATVTYPVVVNGNTIGNVVHTVINNYTTGQTALKAAVAKGVV